MYIQFNRSEDLSYFNHGINIDIVIFLVFKGCTNLNTGKIFLLFERLAKL